MLGEVTRGINGKGVEVERAASIGVALVIVGIDPSRNGENASDPKIWTVKERKTKPETEKTAGQISFPGETKKTGEDLWPNVVGALAEFSDRDSALNSLFVMPNSHYSNVISIRGNPVDLIVSVYSGSLDDRHFQPVDKEDVAGHRWMTIREINEIIKTDPETIRKFARDIVSMETSHNQIQRVVEEFMHEPVKRLPVSSFLPKGFSSMAKFHEDREKQVDNRVFDRNPRKG